MFFDDSSGAVLPPELIRQGREKELKNIDDLKVWELRPIQECYDVIGKAPISTRWVDINKGDDNEPDVRCRFVGRELKAHQLRDDVFSATPPLIAILFLLSLFRTTRIPGVQMGETLCLMFLDISCAFILQRLVTCMFNYHPSVT